MEKDTIRNIAREFVRAEVDCTPIPTVSSRYPEATLADAYAIQRKVLEIKTARGERMVGKKIGLTAQAVQNQLGVYEPDHGFFTDARVHTPGMPLRLSNFIAPQLEAELAFHIKEDLPTGPITNWQMLQAIQGVSPAFEVVDSRYGHFNFTIVDTVADNASYGSILLGNVVRPLEDLEIDCIGMNLYKNGRLMKSATSAEVMGNPLHAVLWLANRLAELGNPLRKGDVVLSGSFTSFLPVASGDFVQAHFAGLGKVELAITE